MTERPNGTVSCHACEGEGYIPARSCYICHGWGWVDEPSVDLRNQDSLPTQYRVARMLLSERGLYDLCDWMEARWVRDEPYLHVTQVRTADSAEGAT